VNGRRQAILAIDEGTSGTRAALVAADGSVSAVNYTTLAVSSPRHNVVEQDADVLLQKTIEVCGKTIAAARDAGVEIAAMAIANAQPVFCGIRRRVARWSRPWCGRIRAMPKS